MGIQEYAGTGYYVDDGQMTWTDELQMMMSCGSRTSQSHKRIAQTNRTKQDDVTSKNGNDEMMLLDAPEQLRSVRMEDLRLVNLTEICPSQRGEHIKAPC